MKRVRSALEELPPPVEDAVMLVLTTEPMAAEMVLNHETLSADYTQEERLRGLNMLVEQRKVVMMNMDGSVFVQAVPEEHLPKLRVFSKEEGLVFDEVTKFGANGATLKQLKRVGLRPSVLTSVIADLTRNQCITAFKPINAKRKVYLAVWLAPSMSLTGDIWYDTSNTLDIKFRDAFEKVVLMLCSKEELDVGVVVCTDSCNLGWAADEILERIEDTKLFSVKIGRTHVTAIVQLLECDGSLLKCNSKGQYVTCKTKAGVQANLIQIPCTSCPKAEECGPNGRVKPASCVYLTRWLRQGGELSW